MSSGNQDECVDFLSLLFPVYIISPVVSSRHSVRVRLCPFEFAIVNVLQPIEAGDFLQN